MVNKFVKFIEKLSYQLTEAAVLNVLGKTYPDNFRKVLKKDRGEMLIL